MNFTIFLIIFLVVPLGGLIYVLRGKLPIWIGARLSGIGLLLVLYGTLFDNYLVASRILAFEPGLNLGLILVYVPLERYLFPLLQTLLVGFLTLWFWHRFYPGDFD